MEALLLICSSSIAFFFLHWSKQKAFLQNMEQQFFDLKVGIIVKIHFLSNFFLILSYLSVVVLLKILFLLSFQLLFRFPVEKQLVVSPTLFPPQQTLSQHDFFGSSSSILIVTLGCCFFLQLKQLLLLLDSGVVLGTFCFWSLPFWLLERLHDSFFLHDVSNRVHTLPLGASCAWDWGSFKGGCGGGRLKNY